MKQLVNNKIVSFALTFIAVFAVFCSINYIITGITVKGGYYNEWVANNADYVTFLRTLTLKGASLFVSIAGFENHTDMYTLHLPGISKVRMVYSCIGLNLFAFWWAFVIAFPQTIKAKLLHITLGSISILLLNMIRVGGLAMIRSVKSFRYMQLDHHLIFNIVVYLLIFLMMRQMVLRSVTTPVQGNAA